MPPPTRITEPWVGQPGSEVRARGPPAVTELLGAGTRFLSITGQCPISGAPLQGPANFWKRSSILQSPGLAALGSSFSLHWDFMPGRGGCGGPVCVLTRVPQHSELCVRGPRPHQHTETAPQSSAARDSSSSPGFVFAGFLFCLIHETAL